MTLEQAVDRMNKKQEVFDDLLEACKGWVAYLDSDVSEAEQRLLDITQQAINKAEGK